MLVRSPAVRVRARGPASRGFTLTELMIVVAMMGILATIGVASFRREVSSARTTEAAAVVQAIRAAQEGYRSENQRYLDVSGSANRWYPNASFDEKVYPWLNPEHADYARWRRLGAAVSQPVRFRYLVHAGPPGATLPTLQLETPLGTPTDAWYVIQARAGDEYGSSEKGVFTDVVAASTSNELVIRTSGE